MRLEDSDSASLGSNPSAPASQNVGISGEIGTRHSGQPGTEGVSVPHESRHIRTFTNLLGETVTVPVRGKHYCQPRGYAAPPGTGPIGETCRSCQHAKRQSGYGKKQWFKCALFTRKTGGRATDILAGAKACRMWEAKP